MSAASERCPECWGLLPNHQPVHRRFPQGGGGTNLPCSRSVSAASEREALVQIMRDRDDMFVTFEMHADAILAAGFTRQSRAEIQAEALEEASHFTTDPDVIFGDLADVRDWLRARAQRIREGGE